MILVNLTCGRNPWKRASIEDSTFKAYLKNSKFLSSILPISSELEIILRHVFECDPQRRVTIPELRELVIGCPTFTTRATILRASPPCEVDCTTEVNYDAASDHSIPFQQYPTSPYTPALLPPAHPVTAQYSNLTTASGDSSASDDGSLFSSSSTSSSSSLHSDYETASKGHSFAYLCPPPPSNYYGTIISVLDPVQKHLMSQSFIPSVQVY